MKRITLDLTVLENTSMFLVNVRGSILGNIDNVIETLGSSMHRDNVLVDIRSFRCHNGTYEIKSRNGLLGHTRVLDTLRGQSGMLMLRPGEVVTFSFMDQYIHLFNQPKDGNAYLNYIVSKEKLRNHLDKTLEGLRKGLAKRCRAKKTSSSDWSPSDRVISTTNKN